MRSTQYIIWEDNGRWHGHLQDYPDLVTHGESFEDLQAQLCHLQQDLSGGKHDRCHNPPSTLFQRPPRRTKTHDRLEQLFSTMLNKP